MKPPVGKSIWGITAFAAIHILAWVVGIFYSYTSALPGTSTVASVVGVFYSYTSALAVYCPGSDADFATLVGCLWLTGCASPFFFFGGGGRGVSFSVVPFIVLIFSCRCHALSIFSKYLVFRFHI
ncbi:hypothetical protein EDD18DRAFT_381796 [Armillaria luteobubalina]|uniref:Uncharacterized protein n=1 Tax=Armillaria luteobubalina TaxID=153913 RepID=A0AA39URD8_9AGAR|nr:hypothetical protein EDD18DRAFT_381796 [Armillaria luteobubalina]